MRNLLAVFTMTLATLLLGACGGTDTSALATDTSQDALAGTCICPNVYAPVCGVDGKTYTNECYAECAGVKVAYEGECHSCICPNIYAPVCAWGGVTYDNKCEADCAGAKIAHEGACGDCICPDVYDPVCGVDGKTYGNQCEATCDGIEVAHDGACTVIGPAN